MRQCVIGSVRMALYPSLQLPLLVALDTRLRLVRRQGSGFSGRTGHWAQRVAGEGCDIMIHLEEGDEFIQHLL